MKVLITGANGFVGSFLAEELCVKGYEVYCIVRNSSNTKWLRDIDVKILRGNTSNPDFISESVKDMDIVFHSAATINGKNWNSYYNANVKYTEDLLKGIKKNGSKIKKFVFISSIAAMGPGKEGEVLNEDSPENPVSKYGKSKFMAERSVLEYKDLFPVVIIRPPNIIGPRQNELFNALNLAKKRIIPMIGNKKKQTSIIYINDLIKVLIWAAEKDKLKDIIYFSTNPTPYSWEEMTDSIKKLNGINKLYIKIPHFIQYLVAGISEFISSISGKAPLVSRENVNASKYYYWIYDGSKIQREMEYIPETSLPDAIALTHKWYKDRDLL